MVGLHSAVALAAIYYFDFVGSRYSAAAAVDFGADFHFAAGLAALYFFVDSHY